MPVASRIAALDRRHQELEAQIAAEILSPAGDDLRIADLKKRKLKLKEEIEHLRVDG